MRLTYLVENEYDTQTLYDRMDHKIQLRGRQNKNVADCIVSLICFHFVAFAHTTCIHSVTKNWRPFPFRQFPVFQDKKWILVARRSLVKERPKWSTDMKYDSFVQISMKFNYAFSAIQRSCTIKIDWLKEITRESCGKI